MHNIKTNFGRFYRMSKQFFEGEADRQGNLQFYPRSPRMAYLQVIALCCTMEALSIDSENLLWSKIKSDYPRWHESLISRSRFNRRRRRLQPYIQRLQQKVFRRLEQESEVLVVDSIPVPVVKMARERTHKVFKKDFETVPAKGYSAINWGWFIGYKLHVIIYDNGVGAAERYH